MIISILLCLFLNNSFAVDNRTIETNKEKHNIRFYAFGDYLTVSNPDTGETFSGPGINLQLLKAINKRYAIGGNVRQTFALSGQTGSITSLSVRLTKAITGKMFRENTKTKINKTPSIKITERPTSGWRGQVFATHYFFNTSSTSVPYTGLGVSAYYEQINPNKIYDYIWGARLDYLSNTNVLIPISAFFGMAFWLD